LDSLNEKKRKGYLICSSTPSRDDNEFLETMIQSRHAFAVSFTPDGYVIVYDPNGVGPTSALSESSEYGENNNRYGFGPNEETKSVGRETVEQGFKIPFW